MKKIYLAADGGGTKLDIAAVTTDKEIIAKVRVEGGINRKTNDIKSITKTVSEAAALIKEKTGADKFEYCAGYLMHNTDLFKEIFGCDTEEVDEGRIGLYTAEIYGDGVLILSGTGADAYVIKDGRTAGITGGYGAILGDEGSGFAIGRAAINAAIESYEGRGEKTLLEEMTVKKNPAPTFRESVYGIYKTSQTQRNVAEYCVLCEEAADKGDKIAKNIFRKAAYALSSYAVAGYEKYGLDKTAPCTFAGGVIMHDIYRKKPLMLPYIKKELSKSGINRVVIPQKEKRPIDGALEWVIRNIIK